MNIKALGSLQGLFHLIRFFHQPQRKEIKMSIHNVDVYANDLDQLISQLQDIRKNNGNIMLAGSPNGYNGFNNGVRIFGHYLIDDGSGEGFHNLHPSSSVMPEYDSEANPFISFQ
jgi:hypothetical protein